MGIVQVSQNDVAQTQRTYTSAKVSKTLTTMSRVSKNNTIDETDRYRLFENAKNEHTTTRGFTRTVELAVVLELDHLSPAARRWRDVVDKQGQVRHQPRAESRRVLEAQCPPQAVQIPQRVGYTRIGRA